MNKVAVVTGGSRGLGLQIVRDLSMAGYCVYSISRNRERVEDIKKTLPEVEFRIGDVTDMSFLESFSNEIAQKHEGIDVLINNAGVILAGGVEQLSVKDWEENFHVNVTGVFCCVKALLPLMQLVKGASIVNVSSISSEITGSSIAYSACKAAVDMMTKSLAKELSKYKIRVNSVNPGIINTGFQVNNEIMDKQEYESFLRSVSESYPLGIGSAEDVSSLICYLVSDRARWISGSNYIIDGGRSVNI
jgi:NAD(P)-dependent dehydrogenase (short-subunit alcohol dehydrogenase family)